MGVQEVIVALSLGGLALAAVLLSRSQRKRRAAEIALEIEKANSVLAPKKTALEKILKEAEELDEEYESISDAYRNSDVDVFKGGDPKPPSDV